MLCPSCGRPFEGRFCPNCGFDASPYAHLCVRCGSAFNGPYCPYCGTRAYADVPGAALRSTGTALWTIALIAFLVALSVGIVAFAVGGSMVVRGALEGGPRLIPVYILTPFPTGGYVDAEAPVFLLYFGLIAAAILGTLVWLAFRDGRSMWAAVLRPSADLRSRLESKSAWVAVAQVFLAVWFFQIFYGIVLQQGGVTPTTKPSGIALPAWYDYFALANAAVYEEVVTRLVFIGIPLVVLATALRRRDPSAGRVPAWRHLFGGTVTRDSHPALVAASCGLIVLSGTVFGLAHVPGYGEWKFLPAMVAGLGAGYLFVRRGILAGILWHFANDYLAAAGLMLVAGGNLAAVGILGLLFLILAGLGAFFFVWYFVYGVALVKDLGVRWGRLKPEPVAVAPVFAGPPPPPPYYVYGPPAAPPPAGAPWSAPRPAPLPAPPPGLQQVPWFGGGFATFRCPRCGWREATYDAGRFTCLRCGAVT